jgi:hypothetical protein
MMKKSDSLSSQDIERLSAYLDGDLTPREREALEARLRTEADLRHRLEELRHTIAQLKGLPMVRAPRNFTLTPKMVGQKPGRQPLFNFFRFASAIAAVALVIVVGLDFAVATGQLPALSNVAGEMTEDTGLFSDDTQRAEAPAEAEADLGEPMAMQVTEEQDDGVGDESGIAEAPLAEEGEETDGCVECPTPSFAGGDLPLTPEGREGLSIAATATAKWQQTSQDEEVEDQVDTPSLEDQIVGTDFWTPIRLVEFSLAGLMLVLVATTLILRRQQP